VERALFLQADEGRMMRFEMMIGSLEKRNPHGGIVIFDVGDQGLMTVTTRANNGGMIELWLTVREVERLAHVAKAVARAMAGHTAGSGG
jgi:hypothetical protein